MITFQNTVYTSSYSSKHTYTFKHHQLAHATLDEILVSIYWICVYVKVEGISKSWILLHLPYTNLGEENSTSSPTQDFIYETDIVH